MWTCPKCNEPQDDANDFCTHCGELRPAPLPAEQQSSIPPPPPSMMPSGVPMAMTSGLPPAAPGELATLGRALRLGWDAFSSQMGILIGAAAVMMVISMAVALIPFVGGLGSIFVTPPLVGGLTILMLNTIHRNNPQFGDVFSGFSQYAKWLVIQLLWVVIGLVAGLPYIIGALIAFIPGGREHAMTSSGVGFLIAGVLISLILFLFFCIRWAFAYWTAAEGASGIDAFKQSAELVRGRWGLVVGTMIVLGLIGGAGGLACGVGMLFTYPWTMCAVAVFYSDLKALQGR